ncbi:MAG TPA: ABC transporter permease [Sporichthyaceae bacterium]|jgi:putative ABC transport system permease protein
MAADPGLPLMWLITLRDLQWRRRRFGFGALGAAMVFAVTLLLSGLSAGLHGEASRNIQAVGADAWLVRAGVSGPFSALSAMPDTVVEQVAAAPGVRRADPWILAFGTTDGARQVDVNVVGYRPGGLGPPAPSAGRQPTRPGEVLVDSATGYKIGDQFTMNGTPLTVVGKVKHMTLRGGVGNIYLNLRDAQAVLFKSNRIVTAVITQGVPKDPAALGLAALSQTQARGDILRLFQKALRGIDLLRLILWAVAIAVIGTVIYLSVLERIQDLAVLKAIGIATNSLMFSLVVQAALMSLLAAGAAIVMSFAVAPSFPMPVSMSVSSCAALIGFAFTIGLVSSIAGLRRAVGVDPATAFGGAI